MRIAISIIFILGLLLRVLNVFPNNIILGFDQVRDIFDSQSIIYDRDLRIVGPVAGNNANLHHGVLFLYYLLPPIFLFRGNPLGIALYNSIFNFLGAVTLYFLASSLFRSKKAGIIAFLLASVSHYFVQYSGWISNPSPTLFTAPMVFLCFWKYYTEKKSKWLYWGSFFLGLSIQFELFFLYLIPTIILTWVLLRKKLPKVRELIISFIFFSIATSTMILTEVKFKFGGVIVLLGGLFSKSGENLFAKYFSHFLSRYFETFSQNLAPLYAKLGLPLAIIIASLVFLSLWKEKKSKDSLIFLLVYLLSPFILYLFGYHLAPWYFIGFSPAVILGASYVLSQIKSSFLLISLLVFILAENLIATFDRENYGNKILEPDKSSIMRGQLNVVDYTYRESRHEAFTINSVTNPLYINAIWAYHYERYGKGKYGYLPSWSGGDQLRPYDTLSKAKGDEKFLYLIIDNSPRIPEVHKILAREWAHGVSRLIEEREFGGILVQKRVLLDKVD